MAEKVKDRGNSLLLDTQRLELEKTCVYLITAYVRMLEKPKADHLTKGLVMSTQRESTKGPNNGFMESSVDPPSAEHEKISQVIQEVHDCIPSRDDIPVPHELSPNMREHPFQLRKEDFGEFFHVEEAVMIFEKRELPRAELVMMYLRAFHNILEYDLGRVMELQKRMIRQLGTILADVLELCYPNLEGPQLNEELYADLARYQPQAEEHQRSD